MAGLLVSVRSPSEALAAVSGGATLIDIKEPANGPLGMADHSVWSAVAEILPAQIPLSVALGELREADRLQAALPDRVKYAKLGLAGAGANWTHAWTDVRSRLRSPHVVWVTVAYLDWQVANAPNPDEVLDAAIDDDDCGVILVDTFHKSGASRLDLNWRPWVEKARAGGLKVALAGGLTPEAIDRLRGLEPDWFAVRGAACKAGNRTGEIDSALVAQLVQCVNL